MVLCDGANPDQSTSAPSEKESLSGLNEWLL